MAAQILHGGPLAERVRAEAIQEVEDLRRGGRSPRVAAIHNDLDPAVRVYMKRQRSACEQAGVAYEVHPISRKSPGEVADLVATLAADPSVTGMTIHQPMPAGFEEGRFLAGVPAAKDVEATHPESLGRLSLGLEGPRPVAAAAALELLRSVREDARGLDAVVVGRSAMVGLPAALMLLGWGRRAPTVTICHSGTRDLAVHTRRADIVIVAAGRPGIVRGDMVRPGAIVIDIGINKLDDGRLVGDAAFDEVKEVAGAVTPVPGGVGPVAVALFLRNVVACARRQGSH
ncbi:MAG: bifunctional 5,10-methylenetetrahydrofolate dehydrogenase/5,10-methenyltetrahydrofolate cyclohydrolase [Planctomycetes bacterium]|nr:bifunctional 5,10-methylenetetrahydrofolate dehydrogenase/5,10-methenyltetrahydrofolate cyclohydrolase [Planctomycetota bacterium]